MRIPTNNSNKKIITIIIAAIVLILGATAAAYCLKVGPFSSKANNSVNLEPATEDQKTTGSDIKKNTLEQVNAGKESTGSDPSPAPQPVEGSSKKSVGMEISAANQTASMLQVRTFIQTVTSTGTCKLSVKNAQGTEFTATADTQALSSTSTCKGFDIPLDKLSPGVWNIVIDFSNDNLIASTSKEVTIK